MTGSRSLRLQGLAAAASLLLAVSPIAMAGGGKSIAQIDASFDAGCTSVTVESSKDLSNVLLLFSDGSYQKFDGLSGYSATFSGTGSNSGKVITMAYVKSGSFKSAATGNLPGKVGKEFTSSCSAGGTSELPS